MHEATASMGVGLSGTAGTKSQECRAAARVSRRDEFETLLHHSLPRFRSLATRWLGNRQDAEDAVQDAMLSAFTHIESFNGRAKMSTWLTVIVINAVRMQMRRRPRTRALSLDYIPKEGGFSIAEQLTDPRPTAERCVENFELYELAIKLTGGLPPSQRKALRLYQQNDFSIKRSARKLGVPEGTLKAQLARGRERLAKRFHRVVARPKSRIAYFSGSRRGGSSVPA